MKTAPPSPHSAIPMMKIDRLLNRLEHAIKGIFCRRAKSFLDRYMDGMRYFEVKPEGTGYISARTDLAELRLNLRHWAPERDDAPSDDPDIVDVRITFYIDADPILFVDRTEVYLSSVILSPYILVVNKEEQKPIKLIQICKLGSIGVFSMDWTVTLFHENKAILESLSLDRRKWIDLARTLVAAVKTTSMKADKMS